MRNLFTFCCLLFTTAAFAQLTSKLDPRELKSGPDFKQAEPNALVAANYLLGSPLTKQIGDRQQCATYLFAWMSGTPDFSFTIDELHTSLTKDDSNLLAVLLASMVKEALANPKQDFTQTAFTVNYLKRFLAYCADEKNGVNPNKKLQKLLKAYQKNELEKAIGK
jgi:hypothetical protein